MCLNLVHDVPSIENFEKEVVVAIAEQRILASILLLEQNLDAKYHNLLLQGAACYLKYRLYTI